MMEHTVTQMYAGYMSNRAHYEMEFKEGWARYSKVDMESNNGDKLRINGKMQVL